MSDQTEHFFDESGYDLWGYNESGHYDSRFDRAPFQKSPYPTCAACDAGDGCDAVRTH